MKYLSIEDYQSSYLSLNKDKEDIGRYIELSEQDIEILTNHSLNNLSEYQLEVLKKVLIQHTDFIIENYDYIYSILDEYNTLETKFKVGTQNCININGVFIFKKLYVLLVQTGMVSSKC